MTNESTTKHEIETNYDHLNRQLRSLLLRRYGYWITYYLDDLMQDTFLAAWQSAANHDLDKPMLNWLCGIALHVIASYCDRRARHYSLLEEMQTFPLADFRFHANFKQFDTHHTLYAILSRAKLTPVQWDAIWKYLEDTHTHGDHKTANNYTHAVNRLRELVGTRIKCDSRKSLAA